MITLSSLFMPLQVSSLHISSFYSFWRYWRCWYTHFSEWRWACGCSSVLNMSWAKPLAWTGTTCILVLFGWSCIVASSADHPVCLSSHQSCKVCQWARDTQSCLKVQFNGPLIAIHSLSSVLNHFVPVPFPADSSPSSSELERKAESPLLYASCA